MSSDVELAELSSTHLPGAVQYATITPRDAGPLPLCIVLMGGGGSRQSLIDCKPLFDRWWEEGALAPMIFATPSAGMSYYVEDPRGDRWDSFVIDEFIPHLRAVFNTGATAITGISMGGYGALKIAFAHPKLFAAVTAMNPMLEPGLTDASIGARNRIHHASGGPARLIGPSRDPELFAANNPANRAIANAGRIRESGLPIYIEAGDNDFVNAHDGTEFLHRVLWDLDISHEYHLVRGADHGGPTFRPRMRATYAWLSASLRARTPGDPPPEQFALDAIRAQIEPLRERAAASDPTALREGLAFCPVKYNRNVRKFAIIAVLALLTACAKDIQNKDAVRGAVVDYLNARPDKMGLTVNVEISTLTFTSSGNEAHALVMFTPKEGKGQMERSYTLDRNGNKWVVRPHSESGENPHGAAGLPALPPNHPPVDKQP